FVKGDAGEPQFVQQNVKLDNNSRQDYHVFDQNGVHMGVLTAYGFDADVKYFFLILRNIFFRKARSH
ncbi:MAG: hypothetical protein II495_05930, partial [Paludibacteraceae bacterium]|nr:hypothetical protein [Paludibacteraceae bacterium]